MADAGPPRLRVRQVLADAETPLSIREIADLAGVFPSTALRATRALGRQHLVRRIRLPGDRRVYVIAADPLRRERQEYEKWTVETALEYVAGFKAPVWAITPSDLAEYGVSHGVPAFALVAERWVARIGDLSPLPVVVFKRARPLERDELSSIEILVALLKFRPLAAKELFKKLKLDEAGYRRLRRRLGDEDLVQRAEDIGFRVDRRRS
jgi:hypothetical protein